MIAAHRCGSAAVCYSAQIWSDFRKYQRLGGEANIKEFLKLAGWTRKKGSWVKTVPRALRESLIASIDLVGADAFKEFAAAEAEGIADITQEIGRQRLRAIDAQEVLNSRRPTKAAEKELVAANKKIDAATRRLEALKKPVREDGTDRIWPGHFCPVMIRDPETGRRTVVPMRYRCRLPGWTAKDEALKPGTYNARRDKLSTVWRKLIGHNHGIVVATRFFESVSLHRLQQRELVPGERDQSVEIAFEPDSKEALLLACLWRYVEADGDEPGFYSFAVITRDPPPEVQGAGHDRCVIAIRPENIDAWLNPDPNHLGDVYAILDDPIDAYYQHELVTKTEVA